MKRFLTCAPVHFTGQKTTPIVSEYCESRTEKPYSVHLHALFYLCDSQQGRVSEREEDVCLAGTLLRAA